MSELSSPFCCDVCGVHKGAQNHWFKIWIDSDGSICISLWNVPLDQVSKPFHCCGEEHALRKAGELLSELKSTAAALPT